LHNEGRGVRRRADWGKQARAVASGAAASHGFVDWRLRKRETGAKERAPGRDSESGRKVRRRSPSRARGSMTVHSRRPSSRARCSMKCCCADTGSLRTLTPCIVPDIAFGVSGKTVAETLSRIWQPRGQTGLAPL
jgi:hypothetical protein